MAKDFKMTELGPIPKDWEVKRLGELCVDYSYGVGAEALDYDGKNKYLRITDIDEASHRFVPNPLTSPSFYSEEHVVKDNDLLVARTGASVGKSYVYSRRDGRLIFAGFLMKANVKDADSRFVFYSTLTDAYKQWVQSESARSGQPGLNLTQLKDYAFPLPPLPEQRKIAAALSDVDEMIAALEKLIEKKRKIKTGAMQRLLTAKTRLPGFKGAWVEKRLGDVLRIGHGKDYKHLQEGSVPVYGTGGLMTYVNECLYDGETVCIGRKGTIDRPFYHEGKIWTVDTLFFTHSFVDVVPRFLAYMFEQVDWLSYNEATGVPSLTSKAIEDIVIVAPPTLAEQKAIAKVLGDMDDEIAALEAELAKTRQLKQGMMQELLTGKVRLV